MKLKAVVKGIVGAFVLMFSTVEDSQAQGHRGRGHKEYHHHDHHRGPGPRYDRRAPRGHAYGHGKHYKHRHSARCGHDCGYGYRNSRRAVVIPLPPAPPLPPHPRHW